VPSTNNPARRGAMPAGGAAGQVAAGSPVPPLRALAQWPWRFPPGRHNALTDVAGVTVGHCTLNDPQRGVCTGVTVVSPADIVQRPLPAAVHVINGYGKSVGLMQIEELGELESPIALTGVFGVPAIFQALVTHLMDADPGIGAADTGRSVNAVVMECNDSRMHDPRSIRLGPAELARALHTAAGGVLEQGTVGAGIGMTTFGFPGGIGTASRVIPQRGRGHHVAALVLTNFGRREDLVVAGRPVGRLLPPAAEPPDVGGSVIVVLATDLPATSSQLKRMARRGQNGLARVGCTTAGSSGEIVVAFSTGEAGTLPRPDLDLAFGAVAECVEEAVLSGLCHASTVHGRAGRQLGAFPVERLGELLRRSSAAPGTGA
jgi:D-aminopeptidase